MDWKQFLIGLISSIAWPTIALTFLIMFRTDLSKTLRRIAHLKYKDLELDFEKVKQQAENLHIEFSKEKPAIASPVFTSLESQILDAVEHAPSAAILLAWSGVETAIAAAVSRLAISPDSQSYSRSPMDNTEMLARAGRLSKSHEKLLHEMRTLRNKVAHEQDSLLSISQDQAMNYAATAIELIEHFENYV